jgi:hypothetical protein
MRAYMHALLKSLNCAENQLKVKHNHKIPECSALLMSHLSKRALNIRIDERKTGKHILNINCHDGGSKLL